MKTFRSVEEAREHNKKYAQWRTPEEEKKRIAEQVKLLRVPDYLKWTAPK